MLEFYLLMFYFTGRFTRGGEVARVEAWPFGVWRAENPFCWLLEAASCAFPELPSVPWQFRESPGEMRAVAEKRSLHCRGCPSAALLMSATVSRVRSKPELVPLPEICAKQTPPWGIGQANIFITFFSQQLYVSNQLEIRVTSASLRSLSVVSTA